MAEPSSKVAVGIDFGGTSVKLGLIGDHAQVLGRTRIRTSNVASPEAWLDAVAGGVAELEAQSGRRRSELAGIGVGVPGFVDYGRGYIHDLTNVPGWRGVHLSHRLEERFGRPAFVDNDVNAMALGECTFGAGRLFQHAVFVTLGTGVGGALLLNNRLYRGAYSMAGEIGHISIDMNGVRSAQGRGGLEEYIGNRRIVARTVAELEQGRSSRISELTGGDMAKVTPKIIAQAAAEGDALAREMFDFVAQCLATAFASVTYLLQPQAFIVGGGVAQSGDVLFEPLKRHVRERLSPFFVDRVQLMPAELGNDAGMIGAATLALISER